MYKRQAEYKGTDLVGMEYEQLIPWVKPVEVSEDGNWKPSDKAFRVIPGDYVTTEDGTGIVHIAPCLLYTSRSIRKTETS